MLNSKKIAILAIAALFLFQTAQANADETATDNNQPTAEVQAEAVPAIKGDLSENSCSVETPCENSEVQAEEKQEQPVTKKRKFSWVYSFLQINPDFKINRKKRIDAEKYMNLTEDQIKAAQQNRIEGEEKIKPYLDEIEIREKKIENIEFKNYPSDARDKQVERYQNEIKEINMEADKIRQENQAEFEKLLSPEQLELFKKYTESDNL